jgi:hypothetical protein
MQRRDCQDDLGACGNRSDNRCGLDVESGLPDTFESVFAFFLPSS